MSDYSHIPFTDTGRWSEIADVLLTDKIIKTNSDGLHKETFLRDFEGYLKYRGLGYRIRPVIIKEVIKPGSRYSYFVVTNEYKVTNKEFSTTLSDEY